LRRSNIDAAAGLVEEVERITNQIRARWPKVRILLRADSGFARDNLMVWCEENSNYTTLALDRSPVCMCVARTSNSEQKSSRSIASEEPESLLARGLPLVGDRGRLKNGLKVLAAPASF